MSRTLYSDTRWSLVRARALRRDGNRCTVGRLLGGPCSAGSLHVHHVVSLADGGGRYELDNLGTSCASHHPMWEALRRVLVRRLTDPEPRCRHQHRSTEARAICEARLRRQHQAA